MIATLRGEGTSWNSGGKPLNLQMWQVSAPQSKPTSQLHRQPESPGRLLSEMPIPYVRHLPTRFCGAEDNSMRPRLTGVSSDGPDASGMVTSVSRAAMRVNLSGFPSDNFGGLTRSTFTLYSPGGTCRRGRTSPVWEYSPRRLLTWRSRP